MKKVLAIGEALIDFIPAQKGCSLKDVVGFERVAGGAPANVSAAISKLGGSSGFISKLGKDAFGDYIIEQLDQAGVDTSYVQRTTEANTGLAFVSLKEDGNRDFSFYRNPSADILLTPEEVDKRWFENIYGLHFCSVDLIPSPMKEAHRVAIQYATEAGGLVSFDPNVRLPLWNSEEACRSTIREFLPQAHLVKISDEEIEFITGYSTVEKARQILFQGNVEIVIYTKGPNGAEVHTKAESVEIAGNKVKVVDTTGAGDAFIGAFLYRMAKDDVSTSQLSHLSKEVLKNYLSFANDYAAYSTENKGAIASYATFEEIMERRQELR